MDPVALDGLRRHRAAWRPREHVARWRDEVRDYSNRAWALIERLPVAPHRHAADGDEEQANRPHVRGDIRGIIALEEDPADDPQEMCCRKYLAERLRPLRHPAKRKHETGQQHRR